MKYPDFYYYQVSADDVIYTNTPQKQMNIPRLLKGLPYWEKWGTISKPKTLILCAWTLVNYIESAAVAGLGFTMSDCVIETIQLLREWLQEGFQIYAWQAGHIIQVTEDFFLPLEWYRRTRLITPAQPETILQVVKNTLGGKDEQYLLIDNNLIYYPMILQPDVIYEFDWDDGVSDHGIEVMRDFQKKMADRLQVSPESLIKKVKKTSSFDFDGKNENLSSQEIKERLLQSKTVHVPYFDEDDKKESEFLKDWEHRVCEKLIIRSNEFNLIKIPISVKYLILSQGSVKNSDLNKIFNSHNLISLELNKSPICDEPLILPESLVFLSIHYDFKALHGISFKNAKNLIALGLHSYGPSQINSTLPIYEISTTVKYVSVSSSNLTAITKVFPNLKEMHLYVNGLDDKFLPTSLPRLTNLELCVSSKEHDLNFDELLAKLIKIFNITPNLKYLNFVDYQEDDSANIPLNAVSDSLEHLSFCGFNVDISSLPNLPRLKILELKTLELTDYSMNHADIEHLVKFIENSANFAILDLRNHRTNKCYSALVDKFSKKHNIITANGLNDYPSSTTAQNSGQSKILGNEGSVSIQESVFLDANTTLDDNIKFNLPIIFHPVRKEDVTPSPTEYREQVFNRLRFNPNSCSIEEAFILETADDDKWQPCSAQRFEGESLVDFMRGVAIPGQEPQFFAEVSIPPSPIWQVLPSYKPYEEMIYYQVIPHTAMVSLRYKNRDNRNYILNNNQDQIQLIFVIQVPFISSKSLPSTISEKIIEIKNYGMLPLINLPSNPTGKDYYQALISQRQGACRHRVIALMGMLQEKYSCVHYMKNKAHAKFEIYLGNGWHSIDLGGYPAQINIQDTSLQNKQSTDNPLVRHYLKQLQTWINDSPQFPSMTSYFHQVLFNNENRKLILTKSKQQAELIFLYTQCYLKYSYQYFSRYSANSYDDLICSSPFIKQVGNEGQLVPGPGGPLYDFIHKDNCADFPKFLLVDLSQFSKDELDLFKTAFYKDKPKIDGINLPKSITLIAITTISQKNEINDYEIKSEQFPYDEQNWFPISLRLPFSDPIANSPVYIINLYNSPDWHSRLLGRWVLSQNHLAYEEGELILALKSNATAIQIKNGLWTNEKFISFWREAFLLGYVSRLQEKWPLSPYIAWYKSDGYNWQELLSCFRGCFINSSIHKSVLNPETFNLFLGTYICDDEQHTLHFQKGLIQQNANATVEVYLTANLDLDRWALLLTECLQYKVNLFVYCPTKLVLPEMFLALMQNNVVLEEVIQQSHTHVICSNNIDFAAAYICKQYPGTILINISNCDSNDLLDSIDGKLKEDNSSFVFSNQPSPLLIKLAEKKQILLTGTFSKELINSLASILIERFSRHQAAGQLIIVTEQENDFIHVPRTNYIVTQEMQRSFLEGVFGVQLVAQLTEKQLLTEPFRVIQTRLQYLQAIPGFVTDDAWNGFIQINNQHRQHTYNLSQSALITESVDQQRLNDLFQTLCFKRFACLLGLTAVGKTTFIDKVLSQKGKIYFGESSMQEFIKDRSQRDKFLFIDEASLAKLQWSIFEGLANNPPRLLFDELDEHQFIIFADNPLSYGGRRVMPEFFKRHGGAILFNPLPAEYIYQTILKPIFENTPLAESAEIIAVKFLNIYTYLLKITVDEVLITPREIQMMALLTIAHCYRTEMQADPVLIAQYYGYFIAKELVPENCRVDFENLFSVTIPTRPQLTASEYLLTPSRMNILTLFADLFALRQYRQTHPCNDAQRYGGLGGVLLEGSPASGKKSLIDYSFAKQGFCENQDYIHLDSARLDDKRQKLDDAFQSGKLFLVYHLNASSPMERDFNAYLMGKTVNNDRPNIPGSFGFFLQYPAESDSDKKLSTALRRRLLKVVLPEYTHAELTMILLHRKFDSNVIDPLLKAYFLQRTVANFLHLKPVPNLKYLLAIDKKLENIDDDNEPVAKRVRSANSFSN